MIAPSHPGFGKSSLPDWLDSVDDIAHIYLELMDRLRSDPDRSRRLLDRRVDRRRDCDQGAGTDRPPGAHRPGRRQDRHARQARHPRRVRHAAREARPAPFPRSRPVRARTGDDARRRASHRRPQQRDAGAADLGAVHAQSQAQASPPSGERADACFCAAQATASSRPTTSHATPRSSRSARIETIAQAGHLPQLEQPAATAATVLQFLQSRATRPRHPEQGR